MSWDAMKKAKEEGANSMFIKLKDGESIEGVFRGEPHPFYQAFKDPMEYDHWAEGRSFKFKINFITKDPSENYVAKIYQGGATMRDMLIDAKEEYGLDCVFKIKRTGSSKEDTRYSILFKGNLTSEQLANINKIELKSLKPTTHNISDDDIPAPSNNDIPF